MQTPCMTYSIVEVNWPQCQKSPKTWALSLILREIQVKTQAIKKNWTINEHKMVNLHDSFTDLYLRFFVLS